MQSRMEVYAEWLVRHGILRRNKVFIDISRNVSLTWRFIDNYDYMFLECVAKKMRWHAVKLNEIVFYFTEAGKTRTPLSIYSRRPMLHSPTHARRRSLGLYSCGPGYGPQTCLREIILANNCTMQGQNNWGNCDSPGVMKLWVAWEVLRWLMKFRELCSRGFHLKLVTPPYHLFPQCEHSVK